MKNTLPFLLFLFLTGIASAQSPATEYSRIMKVSDGFYHLFYDSSTSKSTIIEFDNYVALLEVPIKNLGGGATNLKDHSFGGEKVIAAIEQYFPDKPLKYVLHSHWHPHSISSVKPFLAKGVTLVTTRTNFDRLREFVDSATVKKYSKQIQFIDKDSLIIKDKTNSIVAYRFLQKDYTSTPATEYLYFYFPKYQSLHSGCMYNKWTGDPVDGREVYTEREQDLNKFIVSKKLRISNFVRISGDKHIATCLVKAEDFQSVVSNGITSGEINQKYFSMPTSILIGRQDSILENIIFKKIPVSLLNGNVYASLRQKDFDRALGFAKLQVLASPQDPNAWDTLGEVNYFVGNKSLAATYHQYSRRLDPDFTAGGESAWEKSLQEFEKTWKQR